MLTYISIIVTLNLILDVASRLILMRDKREIDKNVLKFNKKILKDNYKWKNEVREYFKKLI